MESATPAHLAGLAPAAVAARLSHLPGLAFFDSAGHLPRDADAAVSIIAARPTRLHRGSIHRADHRTALRHALAAANDTPGGLCGWIAYDGTFTFGEFREWLVYHHADGTWQETGTLSHELLGSGHNRSVPLSDAPCAIGPFTAATEQDAFIAAVQRAQEWIAAGDIYQVNLSQRFTAPAAGGSAFPLYQHLRAATPAPMAAWLDLDDTQVLSSSPELFLRIDGRRIETRPIKGTRPRFADAAMDQQSAEELQRSPKESAELVMITDLLRNDLGQVCEFGSVNVDAMLQLETLAQVHHLVSTVSGSLRDDEDAISALAACFPGGSITGAPKKRAMEIIEALETEPRGIYCGAIGWLGFNGDACFNIAIRTLVRKDGLLSYHVGAGIVADSQAQHEYEETLHKAAGIQLAIERWQAEQE